MHRAQRAQRQSGERFDLVLTRLGLVAEADLARLLAEFLGLPLLEAGELPEVPLFADRLQLQFLMSNRIIPVAEKGDALLLAVADPFNTDPVAAVGYLLGRPVESASWRPAKSSGRWSGSTAAARAMAVDAGSPVFGAGERGRRPPPGGHGERGAGHPPGPRPDHQGGGSAGLRHPRRAARGQRARALSHRRRSFHRRDPAAVAARRGDLAHQDHGAAQHRRAPAAAGRPHQIHRSRQGDRPARLDHADHARRERGAAHSRPLQRPARLCGARLPRRGARGFQSSCWHSPTA